MAVSAIELGDATASVAAGAGLEGLAAVSAASSRLRLAVIAEAHSAGSDWAEMAVLAGATDVRALRREYGDDVLRLQLEVLFPDRAGGSTACPLWWGLPPGLEDPDRLLRDLDRRAVVVGGTLVSASLLPATAASFDSAVARLEQLQLEARAHRLSVLYAGSGAGKSPLPLGVAETDVAETLRRYLEHTALLGKQGR